MARANIYQSINILIYGISILVGVYLFYRYTHCLEPFNSGDSYTAVIVEPRKHRAFEFVMDNFLTNLDERWKAILKFLPN